jgi:hypothetical protein
VLFTPKEVRDISTFRFAAISIPISSKSKSFCAVIGGVLFSWGSGVWLVTWFRKRNVSDTNGTIARPSAAEILAEPQKLATGYALYFKLDTSGAN